MNSFTVDNWEARFLHSNPVTLCVIRNLKKVGQRFTGLAICNPNDKWDSAKGRHKAMKDVLNPYESLAGFSISFTNKTDHEIEVGTPLFFRHIKPPIKAIQKAYWEHYGEVEK